MVLVKNVITIGSTYVENQMNETPGIGYNIE